MSTPAREIILVTGLSGAGKASILRVLEDLGFETVDNPPISILESLVGDGVLPLAAGIDARTRDFDAAAVLRVLDRLRLRGAVFPLPFAQHTAAEITLENVASVEGGAG